MAGSLFRTKSIDRLLADASTSGEGTLKRTLGPVALVALGIGAIIGAGLFVRTAAAIAERSGPVGDARVHRRRRRLRVRRPLLRRVRVDDPDRRQRLHLLLRDDGRAGRLDHRLGPVLEYAVGAATVAIAWSEYFNKVLEFVGLADPVPVVSLAARDA